MSHASLASSSSSLRYSINRSLRSRWNMRLRSVGFSGSVRLSQFFIANPIDSSDSVAKPFSSILASRSALSYCARSTKMTATSFCASRERRLPLKASSSACSIPGVRLPGG